MFSRTGRSLMLMAALISCCFCIAYPVAAGAQRWSDHNSGSNHGQWEPRQRNHDEWERKRERDRRSDAKRNGIVAGVVGTAVVVGIIAAVANAKKDKDRDRRVEECSDGYGNFYPCN